MILNKLSEIKNLLNNYTKMICIIASILLFSSLSLKSQKITYPKHQIGISYSSFSGTGLNYQIETNKMNAFQVSAFAYYNSAVDNEKNIIAIIGGEYQLTLLKESNTRYYLFTGLSVLHLEDQITTIRKENDVIIKDTKISSDRIYNFGIGPALEYKPHIQFAISIGAGFLYQISNKEPFSEFWDRSPNNTSYFGIGGTISLRYVF